MINSYFSVALNKSYQAAGWATHKPRLGLGGMRPTY